MEVQGQLIGPTFKGHAFFFDCVTVRFPQYSGNCRSRLRNIQEELSA